MTKLTVAGLFAGIGGIERGLSAAGMSADFLCEVEPGAMAVLKREMPAVELHADIRSLRSLPRGGAEMSESLDA